MGIWVSWDTSGRSSTISCGRLSGQAWGSNFYIQTTTTGRRLFNLRPQSELSASWERIPPFFQRSYSQLPIEKFNLTALWFEPGREECSQKSSNSSIRAWTSRLCMARKNILLQSLSFRSHLLGPLVVKTWGIFTTYSPSTSISPSLRFTVRWWLHLRSRWERITNLSSFSGVFFSCDQLAHFLEEMRTLSYNHLDWLEIQFLQRTGLSAPWQTEETPGPYFLVTETQSGAIEGDSKNSGTGNVDHSTFSTDAYMAPPPLHGHAQDPSHSIQRWPWLLAWHGCLLKHWSYVSFATSRHSNYNRRHLGWSTPSQSALTWGR